MMNLLRKTILAALVAALCSFAMSCSRSAHVGIIGGGSMPGISVMVQTACGVTGVLACVQMPTTPQNGTSVPVTFTVMNTSSGTAPPALSIISFTITGTNANAFAITSTTCQVGPAGTGVALQAGQSCTVTLTFTPSSTTLGVQSASIVVVFQFGTEAQTMGTISLMGTETAAGAGVSLSPSPLAFATQLQGTTSVPAAVTLTNTGSGTLVFAGVPTITGTNATDFTVTSATCGSQPATPLTNGTQVPQGGMCSISVTFKPMTNAAENAMLVFTDNSNPSPQTVSLSGTGFLPVASLSPPPNFGPVPEGTAPSPTTVITLTNTGNGPLTFSSNPTLMGATDFTISSATCSTANNPVNAQAMCTVTIKFTPTLAGAEMATLQFNDDAQPATQTIIVKGTGTVPVVSLAPMPPTALAFSPPSVSVGATSAPMNVTLMNTGGAPLTFASNPTISGANSGDFHISSTNCSTASQVAGGSSCIVTLTFGPSTPAGEMAALNFVDDNNHVAMSMQSVPLTGTGVATPMPVASATPATGLTFGTAANPLPVSSTSGQMTVTLTNTGTAQLTFSSNPAISGANAADFAIVPAMTTCSMAPLAAGANCVVVITFTPSMPTMETASLVFVDNSNNVANSMQNVSLTGFGGQPIVSFMNSPLSFGMVQQGVTSAPKSVTLLNTGNLALNFTMAPAIGLPGTNPADFKIAGAGTTCVVGTPVPGPNGSCTVAVTFTPQAASMETASLNFSDNASPSAQSVSLMGTGIASGSPVVSLMPAPPNPLAFGSVPEGVTSSTMTVTLTNTNAGTAALHFTSLGISGTNAADFSIVPASTTCVVGTPVNAGANCVVTITVTPTIVGAETATLNFSDDASPSTQSVSLTSTGTGASVPPNLAFGTMVPVNAPLPLQGPVPPFPSKSVTLMNTNTGANPLNFASISVTGANSADFIIVPGSTTCMVGAAVPAGASCMVTLTFMPSTTSLTTASEAASLVFIDSTGAGAATMQAVALSGTGVPWVGVTWTDPNASAATDSYNLFRMQVAGGTPLCPATLTGYSQVNSSPLPNSGGTQFFDGLTSATAVTQGTSYCYVITIVNPGGGVSNPTALAAPTLIPAMP